MATGVRRNVEGVTRVRRAKNTLFTGCIAAVVTLFACAVWFGPSSGQQVEPTPAVRPQVVYVPIPTTTSPSTTATTAPRPTRRSRTTSTGVPPTDRPSPPPSATTAPPPTTSAPGPEAKPMEVCLLDLLCLILRTDRLHTSVGVASPSADESSANP